MPSDVVAEDWPTILVVDDDEPTRRMTARVLHSAGYDVLQASDARSALHLVETTAPEIALVVTDVLMPEVPGDELAEQIWATKPIPVLFMSGSADNGGADGARRPGPSEFLLKPLEPGALSRAVGRLLEAVPAAPAPLSAKTFKSRLAGLPDNLPAGRTLSAAEWNRRHRHAVAILWVHVAVLTVVGALAYPHALAHGLSHGLVLIPFALLAGRDTLDHRFRHMATTLGLLTSSAVIVHLASGAIEAHFHYFIVVAVLSLYEDWTVFFIAIVYVLFEHAFASLVEPHHVFGHGGNPWFWSSVHAIAILGLGVVNITAWRFNEDIRDAESRAKRRLAHRAQHDELTGLPNRRLLIEEMERASSGDGGAAALFIDLDNFKVVNDSYGHAVGDRLLIDVADRLRSCTRATDVVARSGGDEFVVFARPIQTDEQALAAATRVLRAMEEPFEIDGIARQVRASVGVSRFRDDDPTIADGLARADAAMYSAKANGRGRICVADDDVLAARHRRLALETALEICCADDFELHYQPIIDLRDGGVVAMEALLRWDHPELGSVSPGEFIPIAEGCGRILDIGRWVLERACRDSVSWERLRGRPLRVFVNVSVTQLTHADFGEVVRRTLRASGATGSHVALEITESAAVDEAATAAANIAVVRELGVDLILDDFGVGQSSLAQLAAMPVSLIKLDRSFVGEHQKSERRAMLGAVVGLARGLGIPALAEDIETAEQLQTVKALGFDLAQGYLFGRPQPLSVPEDIVSATRPFGPLAAGAQAPAATAA